MGMSGSGGDRGTLSEINVTPLVDVMLVLLVIFMVTAPMMQRGVDVNLPSADVSTEPQEGSLMVTIDADQQIWMDDKPVHEELLHVRVSEARQATGLEFIYLRADASIPYGRVMYVMDQCRKGGVDQVGLVVRPGTPGESGS